MKKKTTEILERDIAELIASKVFMKQQGKWDDQLGEVLDNLIDNLSKQRLRLRKNAPNPRFHYSYPMQVKPFEFILEFI